MSIPPKAVTLSETCAQEELKWSKKDMSHIRHMFFQESQYWKFKTNKTNLWGLVQSPSQSKAWPKALTP